MTATVDPVPDLAPDPIAARYADRPGRVHLTGIQALARLPLDQARRDRTAGHRVGTYISGYEGSPLAGYDLELGRQARLLDEHDVVFEPGLNEELAATAVQGSQLIHELPTRVDGVVGYWYGKAPGLDRATDALRHANLMGTDPNGGAVALVGDDPAAKSSSVPCASERALADLAMPTFYPADPGEILTLGAHAVAMSRAAGLWTALKIVTAVADGSGVVDLGADPVTPVLPPGSGKHVPSARLLPPGLGPLERDFVTVRMRLAEEYAVANDLNPVTHRHAGDRIGLVAPGKTYRDLLQALAALGLDELALAAAGIRILQVRLVWPLPAETVRAFAEGLDEIVVIEEKRSFLEAAIREALYGSPSAPLITGKTDEDGRELFPSYGELDADLVTLGLARRLATHGVPGAAGWLRARDERLSSQRRRLPMVRRTPFFCSGCPHNTSARGRGDSPVGAGIGCHAMVLLMEEEQVGHVLGLTQMGGEGAQWLGMAPFVEPGHLVQNLGDGTFHHSGSLAIRAAIASGRNITFRVLYNSTVAMTGGQHAVGQLPIPRLVALLKAEGVARVVVTTDDVRRTRRLGLPRDVRVLGRDRIAEAERILAATPGTTVLLHDQECATELRRKRKRGKAPRPQQAVFINERICEGCGDCGQKSNCLSLHPVETEFGTKTAVHQSSCNTDLSCLAGDCPAFMTVTPGQGRPPAGHRDTLGEHDLPEPVTVPGTATRGIRLMGIGGNGIVTTSQVLATAAYLAGHSVSTLDQTGLAQKGGAVVSDIRIAPEPITAGNKLGEGECDLFLGCDLLVAVEPPNLAVLGPGTSAIVSTSAVPTGRMATDRSVAFPDVAETVGAIAERVAPGALTTLDARAYAEALFGGEQYANLLLIGIAHQRGELGLSAAVVEEAIRLNGVAVEANVQAFRRGRQLVVDPAAVDRLVGRRAPAPTPEPSTTVRAVPGSELARTVALRRAELVRYQDARYARRYEDLVELTRRAEDRLGTGGELTAAVAEHAFTLMAYKDEYEVARLALDAEIGAAVEEAFGTGARASWMLHPPSLRALGVRRKLRFGPHSRPVLRVLSGMKRLRGTGLDPFGRAEVRVVERRLVADYLADIERLVTTLTPASYDVVAELAALPGIVRGFEDVKLRAVTTYDERRRELLARLRQPSPAVAPE
ncbi:indolepyruvate ferredoxin oxidoreductase family protein [Dactylosporangium roseum]|uniref:Indolepyruvate ferredoxin oxidoreductase family protein n=1 Tax=Dactylosporangium roseum TaxID=47989 RepID=A0ABY5ZBY7_9ACTN|nr:indolepyruvate ferredoxin oxidoreductase family protein [Dactylosporangium roseum]UWZ39169.1 indolepyruvate ferredoxin oxidoreductase family protein [Dactylosporangium roseum]